MQFVRRTPPRTKRRRATPSGCRAIVSLNQPHPHPRPGLDSEGGSVADISELITVTLTRWGSALYNLVLVHMLLGNNSEHIFRAEADIPLEPTTSGRKIKSIVGVICPFW